MLVIHRLRALGLAALGALAVLTVQSPAIAAASTTPAAPQAAAQRVIRIAESELGKPWVYAAAGPNAFDCSGLVLYAFERAGLSSRIGGGHSALGMWRWFAARGLAGRSNLQVGDLVVYNGGAHVGIYIGGGRVVSTLTSGVRIHGLYALRGRVTAFLHTGLSGTAVRTSTTQRAGVARPSRVTSAALRLRAGPSTSTAIELVLAPGARLTVAGSVVRSGRTWYHVAALGRIGWVAGEYTRAA